MFAKFNQTFTFFTLSLRLIENCFSLFLSVENDVRLQRKQEQQAQQNQQASHGGVIAKGQSSPNIQPTWTNLHEEEHDRSAPIQSRTFKVLQKLTEGMEDGKF